MRHILTLFLLSSLAFSPLNLQLIVVSSGDKLVLSFNSDGLLVQAVVEDINLNINSEYVVYYRKLTGALVGLNLIGNGDFSSEGSGWIVKSSNSINVLIGKHLEVEFERPGSGETAKVTSEYFNVDPNENYVVSLTLDSDFGFLEAGMTPTVAMAVEWYSKEGRLIRENVVLTPSGSIPNHTCFSNMTKAPPDAYKVRVNLYFEDRLTKKSYNHPRDKYRIYKVYMSRLESSWKPVNLKTCVRKKGSNNPPIVN